MLEISGSFAFQVYHNLWASVIGSGREPAANGCRTAVQTAHHLLGVEDMTMIHKIHLISMFGRSIVTTTYTSGWRFGTLSAFSGLKWSVRDRVS